MSPLVGACADRKVTPGVTELSGVRAHIDRQACFLDVGSSYHPAAEGGKCRAVRPLKGNVNDLAYKEIQRSGIPLNEVLSGIKTTMAQTSPKVIKTRRIFLEKYLQLNPLYVI